jgi:hypothetical protein
LCIALVRGTAAKEEEPTTEMEHMASVEGWEVDMEGWTRNED